MKSSSNPPGFTGKTLIRGAAVAAIAVPLGLLSAGCEVRVDRPVYSAPPPPPAPAVSVSVEPFEPAPAEVVTVYQGDLDPYGHWVVTSAYGRCWVPNDRPTGWEPYTVGHWVDTDYGWSWVSDDGESDWGYVTYHYGRWYSDPAYGWVWVPGATWAPAWVAWRDGGGYCGWAPLPPACGAGVGISVALLDRYVPADHYVFVDEHYMGEPAVYAHVVRNDVTVFRKTTNITNITVVNNRIVNRGVSVTRIEQVSGRRIEKVAVRQAANPDEARKARAEGKPVQYAPPPVRKAEEANLQRLAQHERAIGRTQERNAAEGQSRHEAKEPSARERRPRGEEEQRSAETAGNRQGAAEGQKAREGTPEATDHARGEAAKPAETRDRATGEKPTEAPEARDHGRGEQGEKSAETRDRTAGEKPKEGSEARDHGRGEQGEKPAETRDHAAQPEKPREDAETRDRGKPNQATGDHGQKPAENDRRNPPGDQPADNRQEH